MQNITPKRNYVSVVAYFFKDGSMRPTAIQLDDGKLYKIKYVTETVRASSKLSGSGGIRYRCTVGGCEIYLYYENPQWFAEAVNPI